MATIEQRVADLEKWKTGHIAGQKARDITEDGKFADIETRLKALEGGTVTPPPVEPPPPPPPTTLPAGAIVVPAGTGIGSAIATAPNNGVVAMRGGNHVSGIVSTAKPLTVMAYPGEVPIWTQSSAVRQDGLYTTGGPFTVRGITFQAGSGVFHDSMGSALSETDGSHDVVYEDCTFIGSPTLDDHQQLLYQRYGVRITVRRCIFKGNGTQGFGFHQYPGTGTDPVTVVEDCTFEAFGSTAAAITTDSRITVRRCSFKDCVVAVQLRNSAGGSVIENCHVVSGVGTKVQNPGLASVNTWV